MGKERKRKWEKSKRGKRKKMESESKEKWGRTWEKVGVNRYEKVGERVEKGKQNV